MTVKEIMDRFARGLSVGGGRMDLYEGEEDNSPDFAHMDLAEIQEWKENAQKEIEEINLRIDERKKKAQQAQAAQRVPVHSDDQGDDDDNNNNPYPKKLPAGGTAGGITRLNKQRKQQNNQDDSPL